MFLDRVDLKGRESRVHAALIAKLERIMKTPQAVPMNPDELLGYGGEHRETE